MKKTKLIAYLGMSIALYVVLGMTMRIPLIGHIGTDLGYIAFGVACFLFGWPAAIVGIIGCLIESLLVSGWIPIGWMIGQAAIGLICGVVYKKYDNKIIHILITVFSVFIGIVVIKTVIECNLYDIPFLVKIPKNTIAWIADTIPMLIGLFTGYRLKNLVKLSQLDFIFLKIYVIILI